MAWPHNMSNTLLKSDVTHLDHVVCCHGSHECWFTHRQFHSQFHSRRHSLRITLKYTTLVCMRSSNAWTKKSWQRSEWRLGFNSVLQHHITGSEIVSQQPNTNSRPKLTSYTKLLILRGWKITSNSNVPIRWTSSKISRVLIIFSESYSLKMYFFVLHRAY